MNGNALDELLAEECGLDYDEVMADDNTLSASDFVYECAKCGERSPLDEFEDTECDGDVWGTCPKCGKHTMIFDVIFTN
jgi:oligoribonuclease NrnB/cAMP/cGMP phosphodiesterase (DHH superfamily)